MAATLLGTYIVPFKNIGRHTFNLFWNPQKQETYLDVQSKAGNYEIHLIDPDIPEFIKRNPFKQMIGFFNANDIICDAHARDVIHKQAADWNTAMQQTLMN